MIMCEVCKREYKRINSFHLKSHNIKNEKEYLIMFPNAKLYDEDYIKDISNKTKEAMKRPDVKINYKNGCITRSSNKTWKQRLSDATKKLHLDKDWNLKVYTKERNNKISKAKINWHKQHPEFKSIFVKNLYKKRIEKYGYDVFRQQCKNNAHLGYLANINRNG
jgi:hypothetical protein